MTYEEFKNSITSIDKKIDEVKPKEVSTFDEMFDDTKELFLEIYNEYINSEGFKKHLQKREEDLNKAQKEERDILSTYSYYGNMVRKGLHDIDYSSDREKFEMKIKLLEKYTGVDKFPSEWYHHENCKR